MNNTKKRPLASQESKPSTLLSICDTAPLLVCASSWTKLTVDLDEIVFFGEHIFQPLSAFTRLSVFASKKEAQVYDFLSCPWDDASFFLNNFTFDGLRPLLEKDERMICIQRSLGLYNIQRVKINDNNEVIVPTIQKKHFCPVLIDLRAFYRVIGHILSRRITAPVLVERILWFVIPAKCYLPSWVDDPPPAIRQWCGHYASQNEMAKYYLRLNPKFLRMIVEEQGDDIIWALRGHGQHWKVFQWNDILPELSDARGDTSKAKWKTWKTYFKKNEKEIMEIFKGFSSEIFDFIAREDIIRLKFRPFMSLARWECFKYMTEK